MPVSGPSNRRKRARRRGRPRGGDSDATRERILASACACFGERGFAFTTNQDIADGAGITPAALYKYFDSKTALYIEAVRSAHALIVPHFRDAVARAQTAREGFRELSRAYAIAHERNPAVTPLLSAIPVEIRRHPEIAAAMGSVRQDFMEIVIEIVARGVKTGEIEQVDAEGVVSMILACTMGLSLHAAVMGKARFDVAVDSFARLLDGTLFGRPAARKARARRGKTPAR